jgi:plasmid stabilization system protein ParE
MAYKLIWSPAARDDLHDIVTFIARDNMNRAMSFGFELISEIDRLKDFPESLGGEPFGVSSTVNFSNDQRIRVSLFTLNLDLGANENLSAVTAEAEDSLGNVFPLTIESLVAVPSLPWLKQLIVKLPDEIANKIEVRVRIRARGFASNQVIIKVKP